MSLLVDRKVLQSQYSRNNLNIHYKLVSLYVTNLNSLATTSALIAGLSFGCIHEFDYPTKYMPLDSWRFGYFYSLFSMLALVFAILALSQTTICLIFGPTMFLFGESHSDSLTALQIMKQQQYEGYYWSCSAIAMAFLQTLFYTWGVTHFPLACILTIVHLCGYYIIITQGRQTIRELVPVGLECDESSQRVTVTGSGGDMSGEQKLTLRNIIRSSILGIGKGESELVSTDDSIDAAAAAAPTNFSKAEDIKNVFSFSFSSSSDLSLSLSLSVSLCLSLLSLSLCLSLSLSLCLSLSLSLSLCLSLSLSLLASLSPLLSSIAYSSDSSSWLPLDKKCQP
jgi:hypothetical protein